MASDEISGLQFPFRVCNAVHRRCAGYRSGREAREKRDGREDGKVSPFLDLSPNSSQVDIAFSDSYGVGRKRASGKN